MSFCVYGKNVSVNPLNSMLTNIETFYGNRHHHVLTLRECKITWIYFECNVTLLERNMDLLAFIQYIQICVGCTYSECVLSFEFNFRLQSRQFFFVVPIYHFGLQIFISTINFNVFFFRKKNTLKKDFRRLLTPSYDNL